MPTRLDILSDSPRNAETRLAALAEPVTPVESFYVRSNFPTPRPDPARFELAVVAGHGVARYSLEELRGAATPVERTVTLECAGNGRTLLDPLPDGTPWTLGATGTATFTGIPLASVLPDDLGDAVELLFTGADRGTKPGWGEIPFQRSLPVEAVHAPETSAAAPMLAWAMNGRPLSPEHGAPLRLVVPGWYAVAAVKWLTRIETLDEPFAGYFQADRYRYLRPDGSVTPVTRMRVRGLLLGIGDALLEGDGVGETDGGGDADGAGDSGTDDARHATDDDVIGPGGEGLVTRAGPTTLHGIAWSGHAAIAGVAVSVDGGGSWREAEIGGPPGHAGHHAVRVPWTIRVELSRGRHEIVVRARDEAGHEQPLEPFENALGYGNNVVHRVPVRVG